MSHTRADATSLVETLLHNESEEYLGRLEALWSVEYRRGEGTQVVSGACLGLEPREHLHSVGWSEQFVALGHRHVFGRGVCMSMLCQVALYVEESRKLFRTSNADASDAIG